LLQKQSPIHVNIDGIISHNNEQCLLTLTDITALKETEIEIIKAKEAAEHATVIAQSEKTKPKVPQKLPKMP
jgi:hypothetical protein